MISTTDKALSLYELNQLVAEVIRLDLPDRYWVEAEIAEMRIVRGHCFMDLVEKDDSTNTPIARASAKCWASQWGRIHSDFELATGQRIAVGMKVMLLVYPDFHEAYGFSWIVAGINAEYSIGGLARRRKEIIATLRSEGILELQKELRLSPFAQAIAVVSSEGAAGYDDFIHQLHDNPDGLAFSTTLFAATMQGEAVETSIISALDRINARADDFDAVVIIRGGGATSDLSGFDTLRLAENVANFPLPIITGIGHNRDESVLDIVAYKSVKTPTAAAAMLVGNLTGTILRLRNASEALSKHVGRVMEIEKMRLASLTTRFASLSGTFSIRHATRLNSLRDRLSYATSHYIHEDTARLDKQTDRLGNATKDCLTRQRHRLDILQQRADALDPTVLLKRGYSLTVKDGKAVRDASELLSGDTVTTILAHGTFDSIVK